MNVVNCLRRPSSKARQSSKLYTLMHNFVSVEEEQVIGDELFKYKGE